MFDVTLAQMYQDSGAALRALVEPFRAHPDDARFTAALAAFIDWLVRQHEPARKVYENAWQGLEAGRWDDEEEVGRVVRAVLDTLITDSDLVREFIPVGGAHAVDPALLERLEKADAELRAMRDQLAREWPWVDAQAVAAARAEYESGAWEDAGDILRGLQGPHPEDH